MATATPETPAPQLRPLPYDPAPLGPWTIDAEGRLVKFRTEGPRVIRFIEEHCVFTNGEWIGKPFRLLDWQKQLILDLFELTWCEPCQSYCRRYTMALIGVGKKNGKTELVAALALYLLLGPEPAAYIPCAAASDDQADLVFNAAKTMVELSPTLGDFVQVWENELIAVDKPNSKIKRLAAAGGRLDGPNVFVPIGDELHEWLTPQQRRTWGVMQRATAARRHPLSLNITTAGFDQESLCYQLYEYGKKVQSGETDDPKFFFRWWEAPYECLRCEAEDVHPHVKDHHDLGLLKAANPSFGLVLQESFYVDQLKRSQESEYRRYFLNQWVEAEETWLPAGAWMGCAVSPCELEAGAETWGGWDASTHNDSTALVLGQWLGEIEVEVETPDGEVELVKRRKLRVKHYIWSRPKDPEGNPVENWRLPIAEVEEIIREAARTYRLKALAFDPAFITWSAAELEHEGLQMVKHPQTDARMIGPTKATYELIVEGRLEHDGDPVAARHIRGARPVKTRGGGVRLSKAAGKENDYAIALVMMVSQAMLNEEEGAEPYVLV